MTQNLHFALPSQPAFICSKSIIKTERHCAKYFQSGQERHQIKCVKLSFYKCARFYHFDVTPLFEFIVSIAILCHFYRYPYVSTLIHCIATPIPHIFCVLTQSPHIPTMFPHTRIHFPFLAFPPLFSAFLSFRSLILHFGFYTYPAQFIIFNDLF